MTNIVDSIREDVDSNLDFTMYCPPGFYNTGFSVFVHVFWWVSSQCSFLELCCSKRLTEATQVGHVSLTLQTTTNCSSAGDTFKRQRRYSSRVCMCVCERETISCVCIVSKRPGRHRILVRVCMCEPDTTGPACLAEWQCYVQHTDWSPNLFPLRL